MTRLEEAIDRHQESLPPLETFILPGGTMSASWFHLARTVCRRAERHVSALLADPREMGQANPAVLRYLNRLSDLLFVLSRRVNHDSGQGDVTWRPGASREG